MSNPSCSCSTAVVEARTILLAAWLAAGSAWGQAPVLTWTLERDSVGVGEPLEVVLTSDEPLLGGRRWTWPSLEVGDTLPQGWEIIAVSALDSMASPVLESGLRRSQQVVVMAWDTGVKVLEPVALSDTSGMAARTEARLVEVGMMAIGAAEAPKPLQGFRAYSWTLWERILQVLPWGIAALILALLGRWAFRLWSRREISETGPEIPTEERVPAHITALSMLRRLESEAPWLRGGGKEAQAILSEAVRLHLQGSFGVKALERTTDELSRSLRDAPVRGMDAEQCAWVISLLERSDLVKFAKQDLEGDAHLRVVRESIRWVEQTAPRAQEDAVSGGHVEHQANGHD